MIYTQMEKGLSQFRDIQRLKNGLRSRLSRNWGFKPRLLDIYYKLSEYRMVTNIRREHNGKENGVSNCNISV